MVFVVSSAVTAGASGKVPNKSENRSFALFIFSSPIMALSPKNPPTAIALYLIHLQILDSTPLLSHLLSLLLRLAPITAHALPIPSNHHRFLLNRDSFSTGGVGATGGVSGVGAVLTVCSKLFNASF